jgi:hypothetical protein
VEGPSVRWGRHAAAVLSFLLLLPGCSQGARADKADRVRNSVPRVTGEVVVGTLALDLRPVSVDRTRQLELARAARSLGSVTYAADAAAGRSAVRGRDGDPAVFLTAGRALFARRPAKTASERRPWLRVELEQLDEISLPSFTQLVEKAGPGDVVVVGPQLMIDLLAGVLTGSLKERPTAADGTTTFTFNVSVDKADRSLRRPEDERKDRAKVLRSLAITDDVHRGEAVLRTDGSLERLTIAFREHPDKQATLQLTAVLTAGPSAAGAAGLETAPDRATTVRVSTLTELRTTVSDRLRPAAAAA